MESIFTVYENAVRELWDAGLSKTLAIELSKNPKPGKISTGALRSLFDKLNSSGWNNQAGSNWVWRESAPGYVTDSKEVVLEREIAKLDTKIWTCQMSTSSGVQPNGLNRRRAIDLVRFNGNDQYALIELKVNSDNPLYAAFEILGYALAYLQAKNKQWQGEGCHDVFSAKQIELTVLGPQEWYEYKTRSGDKRTFEFDWLAADIANALNALSLGNPRFLMAFRKFPGTPANERSASISRLAAEWW